MKIAVFSTNLTFFGPVEKAMRDRGHEIQFWQETEGFAHGYKTGRLLDWCDVAFVEFVQTPMLDVLQVKRNHPNVVLAARMHRIEMYGELTTNPKIDWSLVDVLFVSAGHVAGRFIETRSGMTKPKNVIIAATNIIDPEKFKFIERKWKAPFRIVMLGNFVPKKRQYTAIQMMYDVKKQVGDFKFDIVGSRGQWGGYGNPEYYQNCLDLIGELELKDIVTVYDNVSHNEVPALLSREHAILSNSNEEGTHVSIAEAMMTGCIPLVGPWRGAKEVYPDAWHFKSMTEFVERCSNLKKISEDGSIANLSQAVGKTAVEKYGKMQIYTGMVETLEKTHTTMIEMLDKAKEASEKSEENAKEVQK